MVKSFGKYFSKRSFPLNYISSDEYEKYISHSGLPFVDSNIKRADEIAKHIFNLLGVTKIPWGDKIPWHKDLKSNHVWENKFHEELHPVSTSSDDYDKKVPWELSRLQYLFVLYKAYLITKEKIYLNKIKQILNDWTENNPPFFGINWINSMEVGIRAANIILIISNLRDELNSKRLESLNKQLIYHFFYIILNPEISLEWKPRRKNRRKLKRLFRNNHYLFNIIGLVFLSQYFIRLPGMALFNRKVVNQFYKEIQFQILDDGVNFEGAIGYHGYFLESVLATCIILKKQNFVMAERHLEKIYKMLDFSLHYSRPDGTFPVIGDNDSGRLFSLGKYSPFSHSNLLTMGAILFNSSDFKIYHNEFNEELFCFFGEEGRKKFDQIPYRINPVSSKAFENGGFYIMRKDSDYLIISTNNCIKNGTGGHSHNDCFSFELYSGDKSFLVDPGCYTYASKKWRNLFRSTRYHNTVMIDNEEINRFDEDKMFYMENDAYANVVKWEIGEEQDIFIGQHYGYTRLKSPVVVTRTILFNKRERFWNIIDEFSGEGRHNLSWNFHFAPMEIEICKSSFLKVRTITAGKNLEIHPIDDIKNMKLRVYDSWRSTEYGVKNIAPSIEYCSECDLSKENRKVGFLIKPIF